ncbi:MAG: Uma2 family endonuclease [Tepidisphaeraceae bacterium]
MTLLTDAPPMTTDQMLALPDNGTMRELIRGHLKETDMTRRGRKHTRTATNVAELLRGWLKTQPEPRGEVLTGEAGFVLRRDPDTTVGIDLAYISAQAAQANPDDVFLIEGAPVLAVEILSPSDQQEDILDKVREYVRNGVKVVWVIEPVFKTVTVYRPDAPPALFNEEQNLDGGAHLPGFRTGVAEFFAR